MHSVDIETAQHSNTGLIQISTASDSSPGSLSSSSTAGSDRPVQPASPPQLAAFLVSSPKAPPASLTASKPILTSYHSASNPQPFFPTMAETPTTWQFPAAVHQSGMRTPSPPSPSTADHRPRPARSTPTHVRPRRHSMDEGRQAPASAGRPSALASTSSGDATNQLEAKVVILGSQGVGKTSIVHRYTTGRFSYSLSSTIGASFLTKKLVVEGCKVRLQIWDTAGQERFRSMAPLYYRGALAAILVYDCTNEASFNDIKIWLEELRRNMSPDLVIHVVGSKADLAPAHRQVDLAQAQRRIAHWVHEARQREEAGLPATSLVRDTSPASPTRSRPGGLTASRRGSIVSGTGGSSNSIATANSINTAASVTPETLGARVRKMSTKLGGLPTVNTLSAPATSGTGTGAAQGASGLGSNVSATSSMLELGGTTATTPSGSSTPGVTLAPASGDMLSRSSSSKISLSLALSMQSSGTSGSGSATSSRAARRTAAAEEAERKAAVEEEAERIRIEDELVKECGIEVSEVSAKDDFGIEDLFLLITRRLVQRKAKIESDRVLRSRDSIMLRESSESTPPASGTWCC